MITVPDITKKTCTFVCPPNAQMKNNHRALIKLFVRKLDKVIQFVVSNIYNSILTSNSVKKNNLAPKCLKVKLLSVNICLLLYLFYLTFINSLLFVVKCNSCNFESSRTEVYTDISVSIEKVS